MDDTEGPRITPWVGRLLMVNAAVLLLLLTVFTSPAFVGALEFNPETVVGRPWTMFTYMFVHGSLLHLAANSLMLFVFGPPVERRLGGQAFILFYLYSGVVAAVFSLMMSTFLTVGPFVGASGALFGVALAFVLYWPDAEMTVFPIPLPITAKVLLAILVGVDVIGATIGPLWFKDGIAHVAHLGGVAGGYLFFRIQSLTARKPVPRPPTVIRRPVVTPMRVQETVAELRPVSPRPEPSKDNPDAEVDRVLDKISQFGIGSLTSQERKFLADTAERKRREMH